MSKLWFNNNLVDRLAMLQQTEERNPGINQNIIEKDWWVTVTLKALFQTDCADFLTFKGGTSLSKGFNLIERFSEDIDLSISRSFFDINNINRSQLAKLRKKARKYIIEVLSSQLEEQLNNIGVDGFEIEVVTTVEDENGQQKYIDSDRDPTVINLNYTSVIEDSINYIPQRVKIEISALSMDEPTEKCEISSLIGQTFEGEDVGANSYIRTVLPTRTFLEKIFLLAEEFQKENPRSLRMSRHLYDLERLMDSKYGIEALSNRDLYDSIVEHRRIFYALKYVDYDKHAPDTITFILPKEIQNLWETDYDYMRKFFIYGKSIDFDSLIGRMELLLSRIRNMKSE